MAAYCKIALCLGRTPKLGNEFMELYSSLFKQPEAYINIITALAKKKVGMTRDEIIESTNLITNGHALTMITSSGLVKNSYSMNSIHSQITADDLFADA